MWQLKEKQLELDDTLRGRRHESTSGRGHGDIFGSQRSSNTGHSEVEPNASASHSSKTITIHDQIPKDVVNSTVADIPVAQDLIEAELLLAIQDPVVPVPRSPTLDQKQEGTVPTESQNIPAIASPSNPNVRTELEAAALCLTKLKYRMRASPSSSDQRTVLEKEIDNLKRTLSTILDKVKNLSFQQDCFTSAFDLVKDDISKKFQQIKEELVHLSLQVDNFNSTIMSNFILAQNDLLASSSAHTSAIQSLVAELTAMEAKVSALFTSLRSLEISVETNIANLMKILT